VLNARQIEHIRACMETLMQDSIDIAPNEGHSAFAPVDGGAVAENWCMDPTEKKVADAKGNEVLASLFGLGPHDSTAAVGSKVTFESKNYRVIRVDPIRIFGSATHVEAYFQGSVT
jgi:hypothetical protein